MTYDLEHLGRQVDKLSDAIEENTSEKGENSMNDIAGLLALMQGNKGMDLPGLKTSPFSTTKSPTFPPRPPARNTASGLHAYYKRGGLVFRRRI